ncbi:proline dehydrogenase family protein [Cryptosporangium sp. NPDC048952]|uniref:proline dehydrogenase family protein n=1 Tax=Cryptosporangium sp. NPDC048952 TaxID=3363961 RepID=UPI003720E407
MYGQLVLGAARQKPVRSLLARSTVNRRVVARFVAGDDIESALTTARTLSADGLRVTLDHLGEDVTDAVHADRTVAAYRVLVDRLAEEGLADGAKVSVKLSALGQSTERGFALVEHAYRNDVDVTFDMEDHTTVDRTLAAVRELRQQFPRLGCVLQSMLLRTEDDARDFAYPGSRVRLVKGAYAEPPSVAHGRKSQVDRAYVRCLRTLVEGGAYAMVATHDPRLLRIAATRPIGEYQMLYGVRPAEQRRLADAGDTVRIYVPFGTDWYAYFTRRLAERPANLAFFARSLVSS